MEKLHRVALIHTYICGFVPACVFVPLLKSVIQQMLVISVIGAEGAGLFLWDTSISHGAEGGIRQSPAGEQPCSISPGSGSVYLIYGTQLEQSPAKA